MMVFAANPCPCGDYSADARLSRCTCLETRRRQYRAKVTGPVSDRIDITRHLAPVQPYELQDRLSRPEPSSGVRARVEQARSRQARRYAGTPWRVNGDVPGPQLSEHWPLSSDARAVVDSQLAGGLLTRRGAVRVHRLAWTLADLREVPVAGVEETVLALRLRNGEPLPLDVLPRSVS
jgi:magnesium chelatase family protein